MYSARTLRKRLAALPSLCEGPRFQRHCGTMIHVGRSSPGTAQSCTGATLPASLRSRLTCGNTATAATFGRTSSSRRRGARPRISHRHSSQRRRQSRGVLAARPRWPPSSTVTRRSSSIPSCWTVDNIQRRWACSSATPLARWEESKTPSQSDPARCPRVQRHQRQRSTLAPAVRVEAWIKPAAVVDPLRVRAWSAARLATSQRAPSHALIGFDPSSVQARSQQRIATCGMG